MFGMPNTVWGGQAGEEGSLQASFVKRDDTLVVLDTCVLLQQRVSDVLMDLRAEQVFSAHWTQNIDDEFLRNMQKAYRVSEVRAQNRLFAMKARCPEWAPPQAAPVLKMPPMLPIRRAARFALLTRQQGAPPWQ